MTEVDNSKNETEEDEEKREAEVKDVFQGPIRLAGGPRRPRRTGVAGR